MDLQEIMRGLGITDEPLDERLPDDADETYGSELRLILSELAQKKIGADEAKAKIRELNENAARKKTGGD